jgi:hypothetical protein
VFSSRAPSAALELTAFALSSRLHLRNREFRP